MKIMFSKSNPEPAPLPKTVRVLGGVSLLNDAASDMIYPLLPLFLTQVLGAGPASLGLIEGVAESSVSFFKLVSGYASDRFRRRKIWMVAGYGASNLVRPLVAFVTAWPQVLVLRFTDRIGKGLRTAPRDAMVADAVLPSQRGRAFGFHRAMDHTGAVAGPLVAAGLLAFLKFDLKTVFLLSAIPGVLCVLLVLFGVREKTASTAGPAFYHPRAAWREVPGTFKSYLGVLILFTLGNASDAFLLLKAQQLGVPVPWIPVLWSFLHVVKSLTAVPGGRLSDRWGRRSLLMAGWFVYAVVYAGFAFAQTPGQVWALFGIYGLFFGLTEGVERALVADLSPGGLRGSVFGLYHLTTGVGSLFASILFGALWTLGGDPAAFLTGGAFALAAAVGLTFVKISPPNGEAGDGARVSAA